MDVSRLLQLHQLPWIVLALIMAGCASRTTLPLPEPLLPKKEKLAAPRLQSTATAQEPDEFEQMPAPPQRTLPERHPVKQAALPQNTEDVPNVDIHLDQVTLSELIKVVFTEILNRPVTIDEKVRQRRDLVTFRTPPRQTRTQILDAVTLLLKSYGIAVIDTGGLVRILPDTIDYGVLPEIRRGYALPEAPRSIRPVFQLVPLRAVRNTDVAGWVKNLLPNRITVQEDLGRNALLISGNSDNVAAALEVIAMLDQPVMSGRKSLRIKPVYWAAEDLLRRLNEILAAEGYSVPPPNYSPASGGIRYPVILLPITTQNAILAFAHDDEILDHLRSWVEKLDQPGGRGSGRGMFIYTAQNLSAEELAKTLGQVLDGKATANTPAPGNHAASTSAASNQSTPPLLTGRVVVDKTSNSLIFRTSPEEYSDIMQLLRILDHPPKAALIELTVAELTLSEDSQLGIEWLLKDIGIDGSGIVAGTLGGLNLGNAGFTLRRLVSGGEVRLVLNALAATNRANVLSTPRVMARNGEVAMIQVGQEVPVITSQQSTVSAVQPNATGVLQTVQYRNTGVILKVKPVIHSDDRIDLEVQQEVSAAQSTVTGVNNSPTISTRKIETKMTLQSGQTVLLGGLISETGSSGDAGIPVLKDLPLIGNLFGVQSMKKNKTELVVLITPYVLSEEDDVRKITEAVKERLPWLGKAVSKNLSEDPIHQEPK